MSDPQRQPSPADHTPTRVRPRVVLPVFDDAGDVFVSDGPGEGHSKGAPNDQN